MTKGWKRGWGSLGSLSSTIGSRHDQSQLGLAPHRLVRCFIPPGFQPGGSGRKARSPAAWRAELGCGAAQDMKTGVRYPPGCSSPMRCPSRHPAAKAWTQPRERARLDFGPACEELPMASEVRPYTEFSWSMSRRRFLDQWRRAYFYRYQLERLAQEGSGTVLASPTGSRSSRASTPLLCQEMDERAREVEAGRGGAAGDPTPGSRRGGHGQRRGRRAGHAGISPGHRGERPPG
jgi:hypothetical protein